MAQPILMPKLGQTVEEASIVKWHAKEGDAVKKGDVLFEIETDKAVLEAESFYDGILLKVIVPEDVMVPVSSVVAYVGEKGEKVPDAAAAAAPPPAPVAPAKAEPVAKPEPEAAPVAPGPGPSAAPAVALPPPVAPAAPAVKAPARPAAPVAAQRLFMSPRAKALVRKCVIDPAGITGTGPNGRIVEKDVQAYLDTTGYGNLRITPAAKRLAAAEGIDILRVRGTGVAGRIMVHDVERVVAEKPKRMNKMRQIIADRLTQSFTGTPHFYVSVSADMTDLMVYRQELKAGGASFTVTDFILEAVILSLKEFPALNSFTDGTNVMWRGTVDLGMAVSLQEGLVVPAIRNAEDLSLAELHDRARDLAARARDNKLMPDEMTGSSFTVSNMGMLGVEDFNAIINPGEAAILAVASTIERPAVKDGQVVIRQMMKMTLSVDHRIVDGAMAAEFVNAVKAKLEDLELWKSLT
jgi:pyruvate dehydrogenase E2 component (dihydrolipoamide acetyltransferase)